MNPVSSNTISVEVKDPATYRLIELLFGLVKNINGEIVRVFPPGDVYVYIAGPQLCTAKPDDHAPSNTNFLVGKAKYLDNGVVVGSVLVDRDLAITEAGLLLMGPEITALISKTCLSTAVNITAGSEIGVEIRFVL